MELELCQLFRQPQSFLLQVVFRLIFCPCDDDGGTFSLVKWVQINGKVLRLIHLVRPYLIDLTFAFEYHSPSFTKSFLLHVQVSSFFDGFREAFPFRHLVYLKFLKRFTSLYPLWLILLLSFY